MCYIVAKILCPLGNRGPHRHTHTHTHALSLNLSAIRSLRILSVLLGYCPGEEASALVDELRALGASRRLRCESAQSQMRSLGCRVLARAQVMSGWMDGWVSSYLAIWLAIGSYAYMHVCIYVCMHV